MSDTIHIGWGDSLCGNYKIGEGDGSSTIFPSEATCEECIRLNKLEQKPIQSREQIIAKQAEEIERLKAEVEHLEKCDKNQIDTIGTYLKKVAELKAEAYKLESKLRKWYHKSRMWFDGESWVELHSAAQVELKREEAGKKLKESEAVVKVLAGWVAENTMPFVTVEGNIEKAKLEAARQEAKTKEGVTRNGADLKRRKEQVYGPSHICYCGVSVGSCQCPKEEG